MHKKFTIEKKKNETKVYNGNEFTIILQEGLR
jgi:hypothetical protein